MTKRTTLLADFGSEKRTGGGYTFSRELQKILEGLGAELTTIYAWCPRIDGPTPPVTPKMIPVRVPGVGFGKPEVDIPFAVGARKILRSLPAQDLYFLDKPAILLPLLPKAPAIAMFHGSDFIKLTNLDIRHVRTLLYSLFWQKLFLNPIQRDLLLRKTGVPLFNSRHTLKKLSEDFSVPAEPLEQFVTYLPVDVDAYKRDVHARAETRKKYGIEEDDIVVTCISNFASVKRPELLPPIVTKILKNNSQKVRFIFAGRSIDSNFLDEFVGSSDARGRCVRIPELFSGEVKGIYSASDIAITTSRVESFGYFVAESMAASLPVVAYRGAGAVDELIEDGVSGYAAGGEDEFVSRLTSLIEDRQLRDRMSGAGLARVSKFFSKEAFRERLLGATDSLLRPNN